MDLAGLCIFSLEAVDIILVDLPLGIAIFARPVAVAQFRNGIGDLGDAESHQESYCDQCGCFGLGDRPSVGTESMGRFELRDLPGEIMAALIKNARRHFRSGHTSSMLASKTVIFSARSSGAGIYLLISQRLPIHL